MHFNTLILMLIYAFVIRICYHRLYVLRGVSTYTFTHISTLTRTHTRTHIHTHTHTQTHKYVHNYTHTRVYITKISK